MIEFHEAACIFPLDEDHLDELAADIKANGQLVKIETLAGKIIDGRRRYAACERAGVRPQFVAVEVKDPVGYVLSLNLHRRQLTPSQRAMVASRAREIFDRQAKERQKTGGKTAGKGRPQVPAKLPEPKGGDARDQAGKALGVSGKTVDAATKVLTSGITELVQAVDAGEVSVSAAAKIAALPEAEQLAELEQPKPAPPIIPRKGVGVERAHDAMNALKSIPRNDQFRDRAYEMVANFITQNR